MDPVRLLKLGKLLAPLRSEGVLIVGSGFLIHNLRALSPDGRVQPVMAEFDHWGSETLARGDLDALLDFQHKAPAAHQAHPRTEHFAPLFVTLGAAGGDLTTARSVIEPEVTFLGAHVVPPEFEGDRAGYLDLVCGPMLSACAPHARCGSTCSVSRGRSTRTRRWRY